MKPKRKRKPKDTPSIRAFSMAVQVWKIARSYDRPPPLLLMLASAAQMGLNTVKEIKQ